MDDIEKAKNFTQLKKFLGDYINMITETQAKYAKKKDLMYYKPKKRNYRVTNDGFKRIKIK